MSMYFSASRHQINTVFVVDILLDLLTKVHLTNILSLIQKIKELLLISTNIERKFSLSRYHPPLNFFRREDRSVEHAAKLFISPVFALSSISLYS